MKKIFIAVISILICVSNGRALDIGNVSRNELPDGFKTLKAEDLTDIFYLEGTNFYFTAGGKRLHFAYPLFPNWMLTEVSVLIKSITNAKGETIAFPEDMPKDKTFHLFMTNEILVKNKITETIQYSTIPLDINVNPNEEFTVSGEILFNVPLNVHQYTIERGKNPSEFSFEIHTIPATCVFLNDETIVIEWLKRIQKMSVIKGYDRLNNALIAKESLMRGSNRENAIQSIERYIGSVDKLEIYYGFPKKQRLYSFKASYPAQAQKTPIKERYDNVTVLPEE